MVTLAWTLMCFHCLGGKTPMQLSSSDQATAPNLWLTSAVLCDKRILDLSTLYFSSSWLICDCPDVDCSVGWLITMTLLFELLPLLDVKKERDLWQRIFFFSFWDCGISNFLSWTLTVDIEMSKDQRMPLLYSTCHHFAAHFHVFRVSLSSSAFSSGPSLVLLWTVLPSTPKVISPHTCRERAARADGSRPYASALWLTMLRCQPA